MLRDEGEGEGDDEDLGGEEEAAPGDEAANGEDSSVAGTLRLRLLDGVVRAAAEKLLLRMGVGVSMKMPSGEMVTASMARRLALGGLGLRENGYASSAQAAAVRGVGGLGVSLGRSATFPSSFMALKIVSSMFADRGVGELVPIDDFMGVHPIGLEYERTESERMVPVECTGVECQVVGSGVLLTMELRTGVDCLGTGWANIFPAECRGDDFVWTGSGVMIPGWCTGLEDKRVAPVGSLTVVCPNGDASVESF